VAARTGPKKKAAGDAWNDSGFEFTDELGAPLHPASVTEIFQLIAYLTGLPPIRLLRCPIVPGQGSNRILLERNGIKCQEGRPILLNLRSRPLSESLTTRCP
jgi:hypothetical protein